MKGSYIGPFTSIHDNATITGSEVEHSIIPADSKITDSGVRIEDSLLGRNVNVHKREMMPRAYKFMVGDNSEIEVS